ncbi:MAG: hypothetical protein AAF802_30670, partial [Planctomycetota bacterium]
AQPLLADRSRRHPRRNAAEFAAAKPHTLPRHGGRANGRFLRHRPELSERRLNYKRLYQGDPALPKLEGVPQT